jgi:uncharacterized protein YycO
LADIIVAGESKLLDRAIQWWTSSFINHVMLYTGNGNIVEAVPPKITLHSLAEALKSDTLAVAYRYKQISENQRKAIVAEASSWEGENYNMSGVFGTGLATSVVCKSVPVEVVASVMSGPFGPTVPELCYASQQGLLNSPQSKYCSELVLQAYKDAGLPIADPKLSTPQDIVAAYYESGKLEYIGHLVLRDSAL